MVIKAWKSLILSLWLIVSGAEGLEWSRIITMTCCFKCSRHGAVKDCLSAWLFLVLMAWSGPELSLWLVVFSAQGLGRSRIILLTGSLWCSELKVVQDCLYDIRVWSSRLGGVLDCLSYWLFLVLKAWSSPGLLVWLVVSSAQGLELSRIVSLTVFFLLILKAWNSPGLSYWLIVSGAQGLGRSRITILTCCFW